MFFFFSFKLQQHPWLDRLAYSPFVICIHRNMAYAYESNISTFHWGRWWDSVGMWWVLNIFNRLVTTKVFPSIQKHKASLFLKLLSRSILNPLAFSENGHMKWHKMGLKWDRKKRKIRKMNFNYYIISFSFLSLCQTSMNKLSFTLWIIVSDLLVHNHFSSCPVTGFGQTIPNAFSFFLYGYQVFVHRILIISFVIQITKETDDQNLSVFIQILA